MSDKCVLYSAHGGQHKFLVQAVVAAYETKKHLDPDIDLALCTSHPRASEMSMVQCKGGPSGRFLPRHLLSREPFEGKPVTELSDFFSEIFYKDTRDRDSTIKYLGKMDALVNFCEQTQYKKVIYLDTDAAFVNSAPNSIFQLLDSCDIAAAIAPSHADPSARKNMGIPRSFPEYNTGVLAFNINEKVLKFLQDWRDLHKSKSMPTRVPQRKFSHGQTHFRHVLFFSDLKMIALHQSYNWRGDDKLCTTKIWHNRRSGQFGGSTTRIFSPPKK